MTVLTAADLDQSDRQFIVTDGFKDSDGLRDGWVVTHRETGLFIWVTRMCGFRVADAKARLLMAAEHRQRRESG